MAFSLIVAFIVLFVIGFALTGAALIREREHGTVEHLLVMPVTPAEIMLAKVWSMALVVLGAATFSIGTYARRRATRTTSPVTGG